MSIQNVSSSTAALNAQLLQQQQQSDVIEDDVADPFNHRGRRVV